MSSYTIPYQAPEGAGRNGSARVPAYVLGAAVGIGLLLLLPGQARADGYGHAEVTLGFPHGQVTVGKTWDDNPRQVVVEEVTHRFPESDPEEEDEDYGARYDDDEDEPDQIVVEKRHCRPKVKKVTIIERYEEPVRCDREVRVVRKVYVERPSCERPEVVIYRNQPQRVIYAPSRTVIVAPRGGGRGYHVDHRYESGRGYHSDDRGPRNLFPEDQGRPMRTRGVQQHLVQVGSHR
ncbi:MAG: hypothetical protein JWP91_3175 [Fibrobacteres bacterium]|nr:hypothetical protein [Fibrobacterota bacterium]